MTRTVTLQKASTVALALLLATATTTTFAHAQDGADSKQDRAEASIRANLQPRPLLDGLREKRDEIRNQIKEKREEIKIEMQGARSEMHDILEDNHDNRVQLRADIKAQLDTATTPEERRAILEQAKKDREALHEENETRREEMRHENKDRRENILANLRSSVLQGAELILTRLQAGVDRYSEVSTRIGTRINELHAQGANTANAEIALANAEAKIALAVTAIAHGHTAVDAAASAEDKSAHKETVRTALESAKQAVRDVHEALRATVKELKNASATISVDASASVQ